jgi:hypothetical protein
MNHAAVRLPFAERPARVAMSSPRSKNAARSILYQSCRQRLQNAVGMLSSCATLAGQPPLQRVMLTPNLMTATMTGRRAKSVSAEMNFPGAAVWW